MDNKDNIKKINIINFLEGLDTLFDESRLDEVEGYFEMWKKRADESEDKSALISILNEMMGFFRETSQYEKAKAAAKEVVELMDSMGLADTVYYGTTLLNVANALRAAGDLDKSAEYFQKVFSIYNENVPGDDFKFAELFNNMALLLEESGNFEAAVDALYRALSLCLNIPDKEFQTAVTFTNLGTAEIKTGSKKNARMHLEKAIQIFTDMQIEDSHHAAALSAMGELSFIQGRYDEALCEYEKALEMIENYIGKNAAWHRVKDSVCLVKTKIAESDKNISEASLDDRFVSGLMLARDFYYKLGKTMLSEKFPELSDRIAVGKAGAGSECFGFDDDTSKDHDFGPGFSMWITDCDYEKNKDTFIPKLMEEYKSIYREYVGGIYKESFPWLDKVCSDYHDEHAALRTGVRKISDFYEEHTEYKEGPVKEHQYLVSREEGLAAACNGEIFADELGKFSEIRRHLQEYYPEHIRLLKIAENLTSLGQGAQYNYERCVKRGDFVAASLYKARSVKQILKLVYLLDKTYAPHDKWLRKGIDKLEICNNPESEMCRLGEFLDKLVRLDIREVDATKKYFEKMCSILLNEVKNQRIIFGDSEFLPDYSGIFAYRASLYNVTVFELSKRIAAMEFEAFDKVSNEGGRADCQDDWDTFHIMRESQYMTWTKDMLVQYIMDFDETLKRGWNMITEKYGRMMESTAPWEYEEIKQRLPYVSEEKKNIVNAIVKIQVEWMEEFSDEYPGLASNARIIHTEEDKPWDTSYETYLRGELLTYSDVMLELYGRFIVSIKLAKKNLAGMIMENTVHLYGYKNLEEAQKNLN